MTPGGAIQSAPAILAVFILDDEIVVLRPDGRFERLLAPGHPRPGAAHATARRAR